MVLPELKEFQIYGEVYRNSRTLIVRARRRDTPEKVILKMPSQARPSRSVLVRLEHEARVLRTLRHPALIRCLETLELHTLFALVLNDSGGESLASETLSLKDFLNVAIQLTEGLTACHSAGVLHNDVNPGNIVFNKSSGLLNIIDFGIASEVGKVNTFGGQVEDIEGTLPFISPEKSGRIDRTVDFRSDFYSLGATFFHLLTGKYIFDGPEDSIQWVHAHISRSPGLSQAVDTVPAPLLELIGILLEKDPDRRYQSHHGLLNDLKSCQELYEQSGTLKGFEPRKSEHYSSLLIPEKLYGRKSELNILRKEAGRVKSGQQRFVMISGQSGSGKSSLVSSFQEGVYNSGGIFCKGKFEQLTSGSPYSAVLQIFSDLTDKIFKMSKGDKAVWTKRSRVLLNGYHHWLLGVSPSLGKILPESGGNGPGDDFRSADEKTVKTCEAALRFLKSFVGDGGFLVVFLDDLQWADYQTLNLLEYYVENRDRFSEFLLIGSYREKEVDRLHGVRSLEENLSKRGMLLSVTAAPLGSEVIEELLEDCFRVKRQKTADLARILSRKTGGNPFFLKELLKKMFAGGMVWFDVNSGCWRWKEEAISGMQVSDNVVEFLTEEMSCLPAVRKKILRYCAALGSHFSGRMLEGITGCSRAEINKTLKEAANSDLIQQVNSPLSSEICFRFRHDRIQQAAYQLDTGESRQSLHHCIAEFLLSKSEKDRVIINLQDILRHGEIGKNYLKSPQRRSEYAGYYAMEGKRALISNSYDTAVSRFRKALELVPENGWSSDYDRVWEVNNLLMKSCCLDGKFSEAEAVSQEILAHSKNRIHKARVQLSRVTQLELEGRFEECLDAGVAVLELLSLEIKKNPSVVLILRELILLRLRLRNLSDDVILNLEPTQSEAAILRQQLISLICSTAYMLGYDNMSLFCYLKLAHLSVTEGITESSSFGFAAYGMFLVILSQDYKKADRFGNLALRLEKKYPDPFSRCPVYFVYGMFIGPYNLPFRKVAGYLEESVSTGILSRQVTYTTYAASCVAYFADFHSDIMKSREKHDKYHRIVSRNHYDVMVHVSQLAHGVRNALSGRTEALHLLRSKEWDALNSYREMKASHLSFGVTMFHLFKTQLYYLDRSWKKALAHGWIVVKNQKNILGNPFAVEFRFYFALTLIRIYEFYRQKKLLAWIMVPLQIRFLKKLADSNPVQYESLYYFLRSELLRLRGKSESWQKSLQTALNAAERNNQKYFLAIMHESLAITYEKYGRLDYTGMHARLAWYYYDLWGAGAKCEDIRGRYSEFFLNEAGQDFAQESMTLRSTQAANLDTVTVIKSSQAISQEVRADKIIENLLPLMAENSGASRVVMLLQNRETNNLYAYGVYENNIFNRCDTCSELRDLALIPDLVDKSYCFREIIIENNPEKLVLPEDRQAGLMVKSLMILPIIFQNEVSGLLYLENNKLANAFNKKHTHLLGLLASQAAISLENAQLYLKLEEKVRSRTLELNQKNMRLREKVEENKNLVRLLCHDLNNSVSVISMLSDRGIKKHPDLGAEKTLSYWKKIQKAVNNQREIIEHVREMEAIHTGKKKFVLRTVNLGLLDDHIRLVFAEKLQAKELTLSFSVPKGDTMLVMAEEASLKNQVVSNIISNAIKFSERKGTIFIKIYRNEQGKVVLKISDTGKGMPANLTENLFNMNVPTTRMGTEGETGTGFGLPLVKAFMDHYQATIDVESRDILDFPDEHGTTFSLVFNPPSESKKNSAA